MPVTRAQLIIPSATGIPRNNFVNTFHWFTPGDFTTADQGADIMGALEQLFTAFQPIAGGSIAGYMSEAVQSAGEWRVKCVNLASPAPQVPYFEGTFTGPVMGQPALPTECAACLSFREAPASGVNPANKRGRVYLGPLATAAVEAVTGDVRLKAAFRDVVVEAAVAMANAPLDPGDPQWIGWSSTLQLPFDIDHVWVDDAVDIQRRRGTDARVRTSANT